MAVPGPMQLKLTRTPLAGGAASVIEQSFEPSAKKARVAPLTVTRSLSVGDPRITVKIDNPFRRLTATPGDEVKLEVKGVQDEDYVEIVDGFVTKVKEAIRLDGQMTLVVMPWNATLDMIRLRRPYVFRDVAYTTGMLVPLLNDHLPGVTQTITANGSTGSAEFPQGMPLRAAMDHIRHGLGEASGDDWEYEFHKPVAGDELRWFKRDTSTLRTIKLQDLTAPAEIDRGSVFDVVNRLILKGSRRGEGTKVFLAGGPPAVQVSVANLATAWDIVSDDVDRLFSASANFDETEALFFRSDGRRLYILGRQGGTDKVGEYNVAAPWEPTTASFVQSFSVNTQATDAKGLYFSRDGKKMFVLDDATTKVYLYNLTTAWDVSTASYSGSSFDVSTQDTDPRAIHFRPDGSAMYIAGIQNDRIYAYNLTTPWDVTTASFDEFLAITVDTNPVGVFFRPDGTKLYVSTSTLAKVHEYDLSTPWDLSAAVFNQTGSITHTVVQSVFLRIPVVVEVNDTTSQTKYANLVPGGILELTVNDDTIESVTMALAEANAILSRRGDVRDSIMVEIPFDSSIQEGKRVAFHQQLEDELGVTGPFDILQVEHLIGPDARTRLNVNEFLPTSLQALRTVATYGTGRTLA